MYQQIESDVFTTIVIKRSKFITSLLPVDSQEDAESKLAALRKKYSDATHNCFAYVANELGNIARFSDDGEPQGTAGQPMLELLKKANLSKTLVVVTRYFGGVKLGAAGLVGAYTNAVSQAIAQAKILKFYYSQIFELTVSYGYIKSINDCLTKNNAVIINTSYDLDIVVKAAVVIQNVEDIKSKLIDIARGQITIKLINTQYITYQL